jgi:hypothetical protein
MGFPMKERKESQKLRIKTWTYPLRYNGNLFFFILFLIIWLPLGLILLMKNGCFVKEDSTFSMVYHGSYFWLFFWSILFFPIAIVLLIINGVDMVEEKSGFC